MPGKPATSAAPPGPKTTRRAAGAATPTTNSLARDKANLDIFWLRDESLEDTANLPDPDIIAADIISDLEAVLEQFRLVADDLEEELDEDLDGGLDKIRTGEG